MNIKLIYKLPAQLQIMLPLTFFFFAFFFESLQSLWGYDDENCGPVFEGHINNSIHGGETRSIAHQVN